MATPRSNYNIKIKVSGGTASDVHIKLINLSTKEYKIFKTSKSEVVCNVGEFSSDGTNSTETTKSGFTNGDIIEINASGYRMGGTHHTVDTSKPGIIINLTLADVSTTNAGAITF